MDRVLIVDDEKGMRDFLSIMLKKEGYSVSTAESVEAASVRGDNRHVRCGWRSRTRDLPFANSCRKIGRANCRKLAFCDRYGKGRELNEYGQSYLTNR